MGSLPHTTKDSHAAQVLLDNEYYPELFSRHYCKHKEELLQRMVRRGTGTTEESPDLKDCVKWRSDKKEWWIHPTDEWVAHHLTNKGKDINLAYHKNFKIHTTGAPARGTNKTRTIGTSGRHVTKIGLQSFLLKQLGIQRAHITSISLAKVPKPTATEKKPHESDEQASEHTQIISRR
jgi:hypothetical protein